MKLFESDSQISVFLSRVFDIILLNALWMFVCIPVITVGAASSAMFTMTLKMVRNEEGYIFRGFFRAFKANFVQATLLWLIALLVAAILMVDLWFFTKYPSALSQIFLVLIMVALFLYGAIFVYVFPLQAQFKNSIPKIIKNSLLIAIGHFPQTLLLIASYILLAVLIMALPWAGSFIVALHAFGISFILRKILDKFMPNSGADEPQEGDCASPSPSDTE